jgi:hypothetical protein
MRVAKVIRIVRNFVIVGLVGVPGLRALDLPNLTGKWRLNPNASDRPDEALREAQPSRRSGGGFHGHAGMGHGGGRRTAPSTTSPDDGASGDPTGVGLGGRVSMATLEIRHEEPRLSITDASGHERIVYTDGRKTEEEHSYRGTTKVRARWKDGRIEVTSVPERGPKITETYSITADRSQLLMTTKLEGGRVSDVTIHRVYDAVREDAAPPPPPPVDGGSDDPAPTVTAR